tara:strand:+ start:548 stop:1195 length:648 start_codon:yes stop_codon:yes gene_type:complete
MRSSLFIVSIILTAGLLVGPAKSEVAAQNRAGIGDVVSRVRAFDHLTEPRIDVPAGDQENGTMRQLCPEDFDTCQKYWPYTANFVDNYTIPLRDKELLILRTAWLSRGDYVWGRHNLTGLGAGLTEEEIRRITTGPDAVEWSAEDRMLLRVADQLHSSRFIADEIWIPLATRYSQTQLVEIVLIVGNYTQLIMFQNALGAQLPQHITGLPTAGEQ